MTTPERTTESWHLPIIEYSAVDMLNRWAAASGSMEYAMATGSADYNGHHVTVTYKPHAVSGATWNAEYFWGGRVVLGRGRLEQCLRAAAEYYALGHKGAAVAVELTSEAPEEYLGQKILARFHKYTPGKMPRDVTAADWWSATHEAVRDAMHYKQLAAGRELIAAALKFDGDDWPAERDRILKAGRQRVAGKVKPA